MKNQPVVQHTSPMELLKEDHKKVKTLFEKFEKASTDKEKKEIAFEAVQELKIHAAIEEDLFYPAVRKKIKDSDLMDEALEEHHVVKLLIAELEAMNYSGERFEAKFTVLAENVEHHAGEEEREMFPKIQKLDLELKELCAEMLVLKEELKEALSLPLAK